MDPVLSTLILISLALVGARSPFSSANIAAGPRLLFRTGTHFILIGFVLGSSVLDLVTREALEHLFPFFALGFGWVGFLFGMQLRREPYGRSPPICTDSPVGEPSLPSSS